MSPPQRRSGAGILPWCPSGRRPWSELLLVSTCALAQTVLAVPTHGEGGESVDLAEWDLEDPTNQAEKRLFFAQHWEALETGVPMPQFEFTNEPPGLMAALLIPEFEVFSKLYSHRLDAADQGGDPYDITDLIRDDATVREQFQRYVVTGSLATDPALDIDCWICHWTIVETALSGSAYARVDSVEVVNGQLHSESLELLPREVACAGESSSGPMPNEDTTKCWLRHLLGRSRLDECLRGLYVRSHDPLSPDMDCDDFADAIVRFVLRCAPPGWTGHYGLATWQCKSNGKWVVMGHVVGVFCDPQGQWWWIDARSGQVCGPLDSDADVLRSIDKAFHGTGLCDSRYKAFPDQLRPLSDQGIHGLQGEALPWWTSSSRRTTFCNQLRECCQTSPPPVPCSLPAEPGIPESVGCRILDYLPSPLPPWQEDWGDPNDCLASNPP